MKKLILGTVSAIALFSAGAAFAGGSSSTVTQNGTAENASINQVAATNSGSVVLQNGGYNYAGVVQGGNSDSANVTQDQSFSPLGANPNNSNFYNISNSTQTGVNDSAIVRQHGANTSSINQHGLSVGVNGGEHAIVQQVGQANSSAIGQGGAGEVGVVAQTGNYNSASITQTGTGDGADDNEFGPLYENLLPAPIGNIGSDGATVLSLGNYNIANISQAGYRQFAGVEGFGDSNNASVTQGAAQAFANGVVEAWGNSNLSSINQFGAGTSAFSLIAQSGSTNEAHNTQDGTNFSQILQGTSNPYGQAGSSSNAYASVNQTNTGGAENVSYVSQFDASYAYVTQIGRNNLSTVTQNAGSAGSQAHVYQHGGNDNTSTVTQDGGFESAYVDQSNSSNESTITQSGSANYANVNQSTFDNLSIVTQSGLGNIANVSQ